MNRFNSIFAIILFGMLFFFAFNSYAIELESRYATIIYYDHDDLREFNDELYMGRMKSRMNRSGGDSIEDEVVDKINFIVEKVRRVLDMFPRGLRFSIVIRPNVREVKQDFKRLYHINVNYIAFYSPSKNRVFYSADNANLRVVAHEIGHVVVENYFKISPPQRIHEVMAQFAESHVTD
ncbi:MAG: hypothetical protein GY699_03445 [Desulfobacteraceae bacterium]|nr:hypothetical protein [Desulfobacteraceae bacterium]